MKRRQLLQLSALGALPGTLAFPGTAFGQATGPIRFGCPVPMSGPFAANGKFADLGMKLAVEQYGTALKRPLAYTVLDTEGKPATAVRKVQEAFQQDGIHYFAGGILSSGALAMGKQLEKSGGRRGYRDIRAACRRAAPDDRRTPLRKPSGRGPGWSGSRRSAGPRGAVRWGSRRPAR